MSAATLAFAAKRAIYRRLRQLAASGAGVWKGARVSYDPLDLPPDTDRCVYFADLSFERRVDDDVVSGAAEANAETAFVTLIARSTVKPTPVEGFELTDRDVEGLGAEIDLMLRRERDIAGPNTYAYIVDGRSVPGLADDQVTSSLLIRVGVDSHIVEEEG